MSDINWNETAVYEFMRFERPVVVLIDTMAVHAEYSPTATSPNSPKPDSFKKTRRATGLSPKQAKTNSPTLDSISTPANSPNYP